MVKTLSENIILSDASCVAVEVIETADSTIRCAADDEKIKICLTLCNQSMALKVS